MIRPAFIIAVFAALITGSAPAGAAEAPAPGHDFSGFIITTTQARASDVGADILNRGGSAADAAVAVQTVLGLIEPSSSGIGGGAFLVYRDAKTGKVTTYDGREVAPAATKGDQFLGADGKPTFDKWFGGVSVGVPGTMPMLALAHKDHGKLPWASLFEPAIKIAKEGFQVDEHMHQSAMFPPGLKDSPSAAAFIFGKDGNPLPVGTVLHNLEYAKTMKALAKNPRALNEGPIAKDIVKAVNHAFVNPQAMTLTDLSSYEAKERDPVCGPYRQYTVCGMGLPSSGGIIILETLGMLQHFPLPKLGVKDPESWHLIAEAERLSFADRNKFLGDGDVIDVPVKGLLDSGYLKDRAALINPKKASGPREAGDPPHQTGMLYAPSPLRDVPSTTHFTIVDKDGNVASITSSIQLGFGSHIMVDGFFLNNELTDFSMVPTVDGKPVANAAAPNKRPLSSMSPTIVTDKDGKLVMSVGSPGGVRIIGYVVKALIGVLDWNMPMQDAIDLPNFMNLNGKTDLEDGPGSDALKAALQAKGHDVDAMTRAAPALEGFKVVPGGYDGGTDKHRDGKIAGGAPL